MVGPQDRRQFFDIQGDQFSGVLGEILIRSKNDRDRLTDIADIFSRQQPLPVGFETCHAAQAEIDGWNTGDVDGGPDRMYAIHYQGGAGIDRKQPGMRCIRTHDPHVQLLGERYVCCEASAACEQRPVFKPGQPLTDILRFWFPGLRG